MKNSYRIFCEERSWETSTRKTEKDLKDNIKINRREIVFEDRRWIELAECRVNWRDVALEQFWTFESCHRILGTGCEDGKRMTLAAMSI
jgi:hypothetical protein